MVELLAGPLVGGAVADKAKSGNWGNLVHTRLLISYPQSKIQSANFVSCRCVFRGALQRCLSILSCEAHMCIIWHLQHSNHRLRAKRMSCSNTNHKLKAPSWRVVLELRPSSPLQTKPPWNCYRLSNPDALILSFTSEQLKALRLMFGNTAVTVTRL